LGVVADPKMVEYLIYMLYEPDRYIDRDRDYLSEEQYRDSANYLCCQAIAVLERIGGLRVFEWLHQAMYWIVKSDDTYVYSPFHQIIQALSRLDRDRFLTALEGAIHSYDPEIKKCAAIALSDCGIPIDDRSLAILLDAIEDREDTDVDVQLEIVRCIRSIAEKILTCPNNTYLTNINITPHLLDLAIRKTKPILIKHADDANVAIRDRVFRMLLSEESDEAELKVKLRDRISPALAEYLFSRNWIDDSEVPVLLDLLDHPDLHTRRLAVSALVLKDDIDTYPILYGLADRAELVATLIGNLDYLIREQPESRLLQEFQKHDPQEFIETAEQKLIQNSQNNHSGEILYLRYIGGEASVVALKQILDDRENYQNIDQAIDSLAYIGSESALLVLLNYLPDTDIYTGWAAHKLYALGRLSIVPQLWAAECQSPSGRALAAIDSIQQKEGLYNPDFSDRVHQRFEPPRTRLRDILLGTTSSD
jgi:hypothetical protein